MRITQSFSAIQFGIKIVKQDCSLELVTTPIKLLDAVKEADKHGNIEDKCARVA